MACAGRPGQHRPLPAIYGPALPQRLGHLYLLSSAATSLPALLSRPAGPKRPSRITSPDRLPHRQLHAMATPRAPPQCPNNSQSVATPVVRRERPNGLQRLQQGTGHEEQAPPQQPPSAQAGSGGSSGGDVTGPQQMELCCGEQLDVTQQQTPPADPAAHKEAGLPASPPRPHRLALLPPAGAVTPPPRRAGGQQPGAEPGTPSPGTYKFGSPIGSPLAHALGGLALGGSSAEPSPLTTPRCR